MESFSLNVCSNSLQDSYQDVYRSLNDLREVFHRSGKLDDSNAKLDEVAKLFATYLAYKRGLISSFPVPSSKSLISELQSAYQQAADLPQYRKSDGTSIFGVSPTLILRDGDEVLAKELSALVRKSIDLAYEHQSTGKPFDILNEVFGHFIRDNFRGNIEDAQYMTPPEVVDFMVDIALHDMHEEQVLSGISKQHWTVLDPSCGVGSFLTAIYNRVKKSDWLNPKQLRIYGQDKVERMVRLSTLNLELFEVADHRVTIGNSLAVGSPLDELNGKVDLILTNPPFGARFNSAEVVSAFSSNTPFFSSINRVGSGLDSELLFVDRNLRLLKDGGRLLIVVPDGVISAKGIAAHLRQHLAGTVSIKAIVEFPAVTFAQAGTRTKTSVLYLQKGVKAQKLNQQVFMGVSRDLGFQVGTRKGAQIKIVEGENDLPRLFEAYKTADKIKAIKEPVILSESPSAVLVPSGEVMSGSWTPNHYNAARFRSIAQLQDHEGYELISLSDLVEFVSEKRKAEAHMKGWAFISVLHVLGEGLMDIGGALECAPKTPGIETKPGELLLSRINPRIPRVCIVPDLKVKTLCSSEFEIMQPKTNLDAFTLAFLLQSSLVQEQIKSLTSGTSASHNRIRTSELAKIKVPVPKKGTKQAKRLAELGSGYSDALQLVMKSIYDLTLIRKEETGLFSDAKS